jgi:hypothetical protein
LICEALLLFVAIETKERRIVARGEGVEMGRGARPTFQFGWFLCLFTSPTMEANQRELEGSGYVGASTVNLFSKLM